jgi:RecA/RadA recombinase
VGIIYPARKLQLDLVSSQLDIIANTVRKESYDINVIDMWASHHQAAGKTTPVLKNYL